jgi:hypothetical protein
MTKKHQTSTERLDSILERGIRIGNYVVFTDPYNFMVGYIDTIKGEGNFAAKEENIGKEYISELTYHATLKQAVAHILNEQQLQHFTELTVVLKKHDEVLANLDRLQNLKKK